MLKGALEVQQLGRVGLMRGLVVDCGCFSDLDVPAAIFSAARASTRPPDPIARQDFRAFPVVV
jgi:hypothetical protein